MTAGTVVAAVADGLAPLTLAELVAEAELLSRVDRKYLLPLDEVTGLVAALGPGTRVLDIEGERAPVYETVYFDTPDLLSYRLAAHSRRRRFKIRTRTYVDTGGAYLEVKTRGARSMTIKERVDYDPRDRARLTADGRMAAGEALEAIGVGADRAEELAPVLVTRYRRTTLVPAGAGIRATLDTELGWVHADGTRLATPGLAILETKSPAGPSALDRALWCRGHRPVGISKYGTGLAALHPELPSNKWSRVIRGYFTEGGAR
jgi:hypothetical protein